MAGAIAPLLNYREAAQMAGIDARAIARAVKEGQIPSIRLGQRRWIPRERFARLLAGEGS